MKWTIDIDPTTVDHIVDRDDRTYRLFWRHSHWILTETVSCRAWVCEIEGWVHIGAAKEWAEGIIRAEDERE